MQDFATGKAFLLCGSLLELTCSYVKKIVSPQVGRIMKLTGILLLAACLHVSAKGVGQTVSLSEMNSPLIKVMKEIEQQTGYAFFYKSQWLTQAKKVTVKAENIPLQQALDLCFKDQPFTYLISGKNISIKPKLNKKPIDKKNIDVSGKIMDKDGNPLMGANIKIRGTSKGTTTNADGFFSLKDIDDDAVLEISYVGFEAQLIYLKGRSSLTVNLNPKNSALDELQVIAYGTTTKRFTTGNVSTVKGEDIEKQPVQNVLLALEARVPGLFITQNSGLPGGGVTVRIQGQNSIGNGSDPLYVIDGVPLLSQLPATGIDGILGSSGGSGSGGSSNGSPLSYINPSDIESIEVLKDADATAIYGSRAANGAILITTKKGKAGQTKVSFNLQQGWGKATRKMDMLNTRQYLDMRYEALKNDGIDINTISPTNTSYTDLKVWDTTRYTDWQKALIGGTAKYTNISGSVSGGTATTQYFISGTYNKQTTVFPGNFADQKGAVHFNLNTSSLNQKFRLQFSGNYMLDKNELPQTDLTQKAIQLAPDAPALYNDDGTLNWAPNNLGNSTWTNPLVYNYIRYKNQTNNLIANTILGYRIIPGLEIKSSFGYTNTQTDDYYGRPLISNSPESRASSQRSADYGSRNLNSWIIEPQLTYNTKISKGKMDFLLGGTVTQQNYKSGFLLGSGYNSDEVLENMQAAATVTVRSQAIGQYKYNAVFSRLNYNWEDKYLINLTARRDGSSRFGSKTQLHNFGSVGVGWIVSSERFIQNISFLSFVKLRASYGTTGSDQIGDYGFLSLYNNVSNQGLPYQNTTGLAPGGLPNPFLEWEETRKLQAGLDIGFFNDRILINGTYSRNRSSNQLLQYNLPSFVGYDNIIQNFPATIQNTSWEFSLQTTNIKSKQFSWSTRFNLTVPKNKLYAFPDIEKSTYANSLIIGQPLVLTKAYHFAGVDPGTGKYMFLDSKGSPTSTPSSTTDRTFYFVPFPHFYGGLENILNYKNFELSFSFQFVKQKGRNYFFYNGNQFPGQFFSFGSNQPVGVLNHWQKPGDVAAVAAYSTTTLQSKAVTSDYFYTDASYIRLKNLSLSWQTPSQWLKKVKMQNARIYLQGQNLITITKLRGMDPENLSISSLPPLKMITAGVQITF
jgi:TonB-linked SusC/RagA family outer membrane protein